MTTRCWITTTVPAFRASDEAAALGQSDTPASEPSRNLLLPPLELTVTL